MPSEQHERIIDGMVSNRGYMKESFLFFVKSCLLARYSEDKPAVESLAINTVISSQGLRGAGPLNSKMLRRFETLAGFCDDIYIDVLDFGDLDSIPWRPRELSELVSKHCGVVPDCWKYLENERVLKILEVKDTCGVGFLKLAKYGLIEDILHYQSDIDVELYEMDSKTGGIFKHAPAFAFDVVYDFASYLGEGWEEMPDSKRMRLYHDGCNWDFFDRSIEI